MAITMKPANQVRHDVYQGRHKIGFICLFTIGGTTGWHFISNLRGVAERYPDSDVSHQTAELALAALSAKIG